MKFKTKLIPNFTSGSQSVAKGLDIQDFTFKYADWNIFRQAPIVLTVMPFKIGLPYILYSQVDWARDLVFINLYSDHKIECFREAI